MKENKAKNVLARGSFASPGKAAGALVLLSRLFSLLYWKVEMAEVDILVLAVGHMGRDATCSVADAIKLVRMGLAFEDMSSGESIVSLARDGGMKPLDTLNLSEKDMIASLLAEIKAKKDQV